MKILAFACVLSLAATAQTTYKISEQGAANCTVSGINDQSGITGQCNATATAWINGVAFNLGRLPNGTYSIAQSINSHGVAVGSGVGEAVTVGSGVPVGVRVAVGVGTSLACATGDLDGAVALSAFAPTPITSAARATTPTVPTMVFRFTPCASSTDSDPIGRSRVTVGLGPVCPAQDSGGRKNRSSTLALEGPAR